MYGEMMKPMVSCAISAVLFSIAAIRCEGYDVEDELIRNPSFEPGVGDDAWTVSERTALWSVTRHPAETGTEHVRFSDAVSRSGQRSLSVGPWSGAVDTAVFVSQYRSVVDLSVGAPLALSFWSRGVHRQRLKVLLDISYTDERFLFVEVNPVSEEHSKNQFTRTCTFVPNHGEIRSVMLHLLIDVPLDEPIYIDDVSLRPVRRLLDAPSECPLYTSSFPINRHVQPSFLSPSSEPISDDTGSPSITLATQLTEDRLDMVEQTAAIWRGPISAALLLYGPPSAAQMAKITTRYYSSEALQSFVTLHVVWEDLVNNNDGRMYPANALRNVAIAHSATEFVFYVDADIFPAFSEAQATRWLTASVEEAKVLSPSSMSSGCERCAFVVPLFNWDSQTTSGYPQTKEELRVRLREPSSDIKGCQLVSHVVVDYGKWLSRSETYRIDYVEDMEPYFIVTSKAPLMNDMYTGYGRDKCAYSRDLDADGFEFYVLPEAFLINLPDVATDNTIMFRAKGIPVRLFLNADFHKNDLLHGHIRSPATYRSNSSDKESVGRTLNASTKRPTDTAVKEISSNTTAATVTPAATGTAAATATPAATGTVAATAATVVNSEPVDQDGGIGCGAVFFDMKVSLIPEIVIAADNFVPPDRKDILIERLMKGYGVYTFVEIPALATVGSLRFMLPLVHPEALVSLYPASDSDEHIVKGVYHAYRTKGNVTEGIGRVVANHSGPKLYAVNVDKLSESKAMEYVLACLRAATDADVILIDDGGGTKSDSFWNHLFSDMCVIHAGWRTYRRDRFVVMKSELLRNAPPLELPPVLDCVENFRPRSDRTTDIVLFSKNRPLQTFAFMDSLKRMVTGLNKVWLLLKTEDAIFDRGYEMIVDCFASFVTVEVVRQNGSSTFGAQILDILDRSSADCVMLAVDEIIWLRPVNLSVVSSLLHDCDRDATSTFQLRLGENIRCLGRPGEHASRFHPFAFDGDISAFYPRRLPYDFGYVLNVDGVVTRRGDLIDDLRVFLGTCRTPACLEQGWITNWLHVRSRQWHLMYRHSRMVNNMGMSDGRVADRQQGPAEGSYQLARILVEERKRIDVEGFSRTNRDHANTHQTGAVDFVDLDFC